MASNVIFAGLSLLSNRQKYGHVTRATSVSDVLAPVHFAGPLLTCFLACLLACDKVILYYIIILFVYYIIWSHNNDNAKLSVKMASLYKQSRSLSWES